MPDTADELQRYSAGNLLLDAGTREVTRDGRVINLPGLSFDLLLALTRHAPNIVSIDELMDEVWAGRVVNAETVTKRVEMVREALGDDSHEPRYISLVRGHGYRLIVPVEAAAPEASGKRRKYAYPILAGIAIAALLLAFIELGHDAGNIETPAARSVAVLPFENRSAREEDAFFVDGIHDDLLTMLTKLGDLKVISRTTMVRLDTDLSIQEIGRELDVATILEGGVQRAGDRVRITVQLIDAATDSHLWAEFYDRELSAANIFDIQREIATAIARSLRDELSPQEHERLETVPTQSLAALEAYFLGRQRAATLSSGGLAEAIELFEQAVELDPDFALAYVAIAVTLVAIEFVAGSSTEEMRVKSELAINKALELDDRLGEAYASLGLLNIDIDRWKAEAAFKRALELAPSYANTHEWYSILLAQSGRIAEGLAHIQRAVELDPLSVPKNHNLARSYAGLGQYDEAMEQFERNIAMEPMFTLSYDGIGTLYQTAYGRLDKAVPWFEKVVEIDPGNSNGLVWLGLAVLDLGDDEQAEHWIGRSLELAPDGFLTNMAMHILHMYRGEDELAADYAKKVLQAVPREWRGRVAAAYLRDRDLRAGRFAEARARYETAFPELLSRNEPVIDGSNYGAAINLALILFATGETERANHLLDRSQSFIDTVQRLGFAGTWISDVQIYALRGQTAEALAALREAIDSGWRSLWWYYLKHDKTLDSLRGLPAFQAMVTEIESDMAEQLARVHEADVKGELAPTP